MLTLPPFTLHEPRSIDEAVTLLGQFGSQAKVLAGGTDLLPNMKHRLFTPQHVVSLGQIPNLDSVSLGDGVMSLGPQITLAKLARHPWVVRHLPSLSKAALHVAGPQLREMGTLGGNLCLDTRCVYYNQTYFWRKALGFCLKKDGTLCHVVQGGKRCVAAASNDTAPVLMSLDAAVQLASPRGIRRVPLRQFYVPDGIHNTVLGPDELLVDVVVPVEPSVVAGYEKLRIRAAIDYPALTVATAAAVTDSRIDWVRVVVSALGARPHELGRLESFRGRPLDATTVHEIGLMAGKQCHPLTNIGVDPQWRKDILPGLVAKAFGTSVRRGA